MAWELEIGHPPDDFCVLHKCDNPPCVNPAHLFLGTNRDNTHDAMAKGRMARGEANGSARLTRAEVIEIRRRYAAGGTTHRTLGVEYGVSRTTISYIVRRQCWRYV